MTELDFAARYLGEYTVKGHEIVPRYCPYCNGGPHRDKYTFALNMENHTFNCKRGSCDKSGHFVQLCNDFGAETEYTPKVERHYKKAEIKSEPAQSPVMAYLDKRGISKKTADAFGIGQDSSGNIVFPYYRTAADFNEKTPTFNKFRKPKKLEKGERKMWREADTEPILYGMHLCNVDKKTLYLFEGEFDAMCGYQATGLNCVSVPSGCEDFTWIETCGEWLDQFKAIVVMADRDAPGRKMLREISMKLDCAVMRPDFDGYAECKDANEILVRYSAEKLAEAMRNVRPVEIQGLLNLAEVESAEIDKLTRTLSGIPMLDSATGGMLMGDLSIWTGKRGEGKSTILTQILLDAINQGKRVCAYSGEIPAERFKYVVNLQAAGDKYAKERQDDLLERNVQYVPRETIHQIEDWYNGKFWLYDNRAVENDETNSILRIFELAYKRYDCRIFIVDNLMTVSTCRNDADYYQLQADFTIKLRKLAEKINSHIHLVVHPRKGEVKDGDSVGGLSTITNIACNVFSMKREPEDGREVPEHDATITCLKNRLYGDNVAVKLSYSKKSRRYTQLGREQTQYSWQPDIEPYQGEIPFGGAS